jgi:hypothetical protein
MSVAALKQESLHIFSPPPTTDWAAIWVGDDVKAFEKNTDRFESEMLRWRTKTASDLRVAFEKMKVAARDVPSAVRIAAVHEAVEPTLKAVEEVIEAYSIPMHSTPEFSDRIDLIGKLSASTGKSLRKLMRRIEKIRVAQHNFCVDMYYSLIAFQSEFDPEGNEGESFSEGAKASAFLRKLIA